ncbi:MAG: amidohydrolase family protein, partial [Ignavibacteria bacterium]|nr:amidohydrolase family protein [Ignavibacteria bacterium]
LEPGKRADLVVLSGDIMLIEPQRIPATNVDLTIIDGQIVYSSGAIRSATQAQHRKASLH